MHQKVLERKSEFLNGNKKRCFKRNFVESFVLFPESTELFFCQKISIFSLKLFKVFLKNPFEQSRKLKTNKNKR